jgi:hypothetical protein
MKIPTYEATAIEAANNDIAASVDRSVKKVMSSKQIVARIMQAVVSEYKDCTIDEIISLIGKVSVSSVTVDQDNILPVIINEGTEDNSINDGKRVYDIKFTARTPDNETIALIINIEVQNNFNSGYKLIKRALYYTARMISSQYGTVFTKSDFDKIQKVYSIWICTSPDEKHLNTISRYKITHDDLLGKVVDTYKDVLDYDLINVIMICLGDSDTKECRGIIRMLRTLFSNQCSLNEKKAIMENEYNIPMTEDFVKEVEDMCNVSSMYYNDGRQEGRLEGRLEGKLEGKLEEKKSVIAELFKQKIPVDIIAKAVKLSVPETEEIINSNK